MMQITNFTSSSTPAAETPKIKEIVFNPLRVGNDYASLKSKQKSEGLSVGEHALIEAFDKVNKSLEGTPQRYEFKLHQSTGDLVIKVYNKETNELIREIPPEKMIEVIEGLQKLVVGAIIDEKR